MTDAFVIMQIGNADLDTVYRDVFIPALKASGLEPKRVDKHNKGELLKSEIIRFIEGAEIIIADVTNERPNCYLEIGYAMGINKFQNLIITAREDHFHESPNFRKDGPKIHFDLGGYDILFWDPKNLDAFQAELRRRIERRRAILTPNVMSTPWNEEWIQAQREIGIPRLAEIGKDGNMEVRFALDAPKTSKTQRELLVAARAAPIDTFGWPIGVVLGSEELSPKPRADGIFADILVKDRSSYDYWAIARNGDFYLYKSLFEDGKDPSRVFFNTRLIRVTETLLYCGRLYNRLGIPPTNSVNIAIKHSGFKGRVLDGIGSRKFFDVFGPTRENQSEAFIRTTLEQLETNLVAHVKTVLAPFLCCSIFSNYEMKSTKKS